LDWEKRNKLSLSQYSAVTALAHRPILTGSLPQRNGIVGNGWYSSGTSGETSFGANQILGSIEKIWDGTYGKQDSSFTVANYVFVVQV